MSLADWLEIPSHLIGWLSALLGSGSVIFLGLITFGILVVRRPKVLESLPKPLRRAILHCEITFTVAALMASAAVIMLPWLLAGIEYAKVSDLVTFDTAMVLTPGQIAVAWLLIYYISSFLWFAPKKGQRVRAIRNLTVPARVGVIVFCLGASFAPSLLMLVLSFITPGVAGQAVRSSFWVSSRVVAVSIVIAAMAWLGVKFIRWRAPIPDAPLAIDLAHRRVDVDRLLVGSGMFMGSMVAHAYQLTAVVFYNVGYYFWSAVWLIMAWTISITTVAISLVPSTILASHDARASFRVRRMEEDLARGKTDAFDFTSDILPSEAEIAAAAHEVCHLDEGPSKSDKRRPGKEQDKYVPGSGNAPEELAEAIAYLAVAAQAAGQELSDEQTDALKQLVNASTSLMEKRANINEGAYGQLPESYFATAPDDGKDGKKKKKEKKADPPPIALSLLSQQVSTSINRDELKKKAEERKASGQAYTPRMPAAARAPEAPHAPADLRGLSRQERRRLREAAAQAAHAAGSANISPAPAPGVAAPGVAAPAPAPAPSAAQPLSRRERRMAKGQHPQA